MSPRIITPEEARFTEHHADSVAYALGCFRNIPGLSRDEVAQVARLALWEASCRWRRPSEKFGDFRHYSRAVIRNKLRTEFSKAVRRVRREHLEDPSAPLFSMVATLDADARTHAERGDVREQIAAAISRLADREACTVRAWLVSPALSDIADVMGLRSIQSAHQHRNRAFAALRSTLTA